MYVLRADQASPQISFLVFCTLALLGVDNGTGKRRYLIPADRLPHGMKVRTTFPVTAVLVLMNTVVVVVM